MAEAQKKYHALAEFYRDNLQHYFEDFESEEAVDAIVTHLKQGTADSLKEAKQLWIHQKEIRDLQEQLRAERRRNADFARAVVEDLSDLNGAVRSGRAQAAHADRNARVAGAQAFGAWCAANN